MIKVFYTKFSIPFSKEKWQYYFQQMPKDIQERMERYRKEKNKHQLLLGRLLLKYGMAQLGYVDFALADLSYNEQNCPYWKKEIQFNIAHSENVVACAFSDRARIGIDVEKIRAIDLKNFEYILNDLDQQQIQQAGNAANVFFKIWTIKEAVTKALGKGLSIDVQPIFRESDYAILDGEKWYYRSLDFGTGFAGHLVSDKNVLDEVVLLKVEF